MFQTESKIQDQKYSLGNNIERTTEMLIFEKLSKVKQSINCDETHFENYYYTEHAQWAVEWKPQPSAVSNLLPWGLEEIAELSVSQAPLCWSCGGGWLERDAFVGGVPFRRPGALAMPKRFEIYVLLRQLYTA